MDMAKWMRSVKDTLVEQDRRIRKVGSDLALVSSTQMPFVGAQNYKAQSVPPGSWYNVDFWSPDFVHPEITMSGGPEGRTTWTLARSGLYDFRFLVMFRNDISSAGVRGASVWLNGIQLATYYAPPLVAQADYASASVNMMYRLASPGATCQFRVLQNTAGNVNLHPGWYTSCSIRRVGD